MLYSEINDWFLMGPLINPLTLTICHLVLFFYLETGRLDSYIDIYVDEDKAIKTFRYIRVYLALLHWNILILLIYYGYQLDYNLFCEAPSKLEEHTTKQGFFNRLFRWPPFSKRDKTLDEYAKTIADREIAVAGALWWYMVAKLLEQLEQVVFRVANNNIKNIDLAHHTGMTIFAWVGLKHAPGGSTAILEGINCAFLSFAYTHASVRSFFPGILSDDVWDKIKTGLLYTKNFHFLVTVLHCLSILLCSKCGYSKGLSAMIFIAVIALVFSSIYTDTGSPSGGDGFVKQPAKRVQARKKVAPVKNKNKRGRKKKYNDESDDDPEHFFRDRLEGYGNYDDLVTPFIVQKPEHKEPIYVFTGRSFP